MGESLVARGPVRVIPARDDAVNWPGAAPWLIALAGLVGGGGYGLIERSNYLEEKAARIQDRADAEDAVARARANDARISRQLEDAHAAEVNKLKEQANARDVAITQAPVTVDCVASPAMRALFDSLRARPGEAGPGQSGAAGRVGTRMP